MPYLKQPEEPFAATRRLLRGYFKTVELAKVLSVSPGTARSKVENPGRITLEDLKLINQRGHISKEELMEVVAKW